MEKKEISCEYVYWGNGIMMCPKPAVYTLRLEGKVYHYCKEHYQEVKSDFDSMNNE